MKLSEFKDLCDREWGEARGDVIGLALTDESYEELTTEALLEREGRTFSLLVADSELAAIRAGEAIPSLLNPVTLSAVKVTKGASIDSAEVTRHYGRAMDVTASPGVKITRGRLAIPQ